MNKKVKFAGMIVAILFMAIISLSGCTTTEEANIPDFNMVESEHYRIYSLGEKSLDDILDILEEEYAQGSILITGSEPPICIGGRAHAMLIFRKAEV